MREGEFGWQGHAGWSYRLHSQKGIVRSRHGGPWEHVPPTGLRVATIERGLRPLIETMQELLDQLVADVGVDKKGEPRFKNNETKALYVKAKMMAAQMVHADKGRKPPPVVTPTKGLHQTLTEDRRRRLITSLQSAPVRRCYSLHECALCGKDIVNGEYYADRDYGRRAHYDCVPGLGKEILTDEEL